MPRSDKVIIGTNEFTTLVAVTSREHAQGLMFKAWPPPVMSFPYEKTMVRKFWMKDTPSPLDIIFCRDNVVLGVYDGDPMSLICVGSEEPSDLVVELPHGTAAELNIQAGDTVKLLCSLQTTTKQINYKLGKIF